MFYDPLTYLFPSYKLLRRMNNLIIIYIFFKLLSEMFWEMAIQDRDTYNDSLV